MTERLWPICGFAVAVLVVGGAMFACSVQGQSAPAETLTARIVANSLAELERANGKPIILPALFPRSGVWREYVVRLIDVTDIHSWKRAEPPKPGEYDIRIRPILKQ